MPTIAIGSVAGLLGVASRGSASSQARSASRFGRKLADLFVEGAHAGRLRKAIRSATDASSARPERPSIALDRVAGGRCSEPASPALPALPGLSPEPTLAEIARQCPDMRPTEYQRGRQAASAPGSISQPIADFSAIKESMPSSFKG